MKIKAKHVTQNGKLVPIKMPSFVTIPGMEKKAFRALQQGNEVEVSEETGNNLVDRGFVGVAIAMTITAQQEKKKGGK